MTGNSSQFKLDNATLAIFQNGNASITISVIYIIISAINLVGNGLSMWLLIFRTCPKTPSIIFMINLTFTDLALGSVLPFQIVYLLKGYNWTLGPQMCSFVTLVFYTNMYCSILTMMAIGIDRYLGIIRPMWFRQRRERKYIAVLSCLLMWGVVLCVLHPLMIDLTFKVPELNILTCFDMLKSNMLPNKLAWVAFVGGMVIVLFLLPFLVTTFCYLSVIRKLAKDSRTAQKRRAILLAVIVLLVFTLCFAPNNILLLTHAVLKIFYGKSLYMAYKLSLSFSCLNSCLDPFIYYFACKDFRQKLRQILNLQSHSSADSTKMEHKESFFSAHCTFEGPERENSKVSLVPQHTTA